MLRFKRIHRGPTQLPVGLPPAVQPGTFGFALHHLVHTTLTVEQLQRQHNAMIAMAHPPRVRRSGSTACMVRQERDCPCGKILLV